MSNCKHHSKSLILLTSYKSLQTCGKYDIITAISESARLAKQLHNKEVEENIQYLKQLTYAVLYLSKQELPLCEYKKGTDSFNRGNYREP